MERHHWSNWQLVHSEVLEGNVCYRPNLDPLEICQETFNSTLVKKTKYNLLYEINIFQLF